MSIKSIVSSMSVRIKVIICCCAAAVVAAAVAVGVIMNREDTYRVLKVFEMTGNAVISREGLGELDAYVGMNLENGDTVSVGEDSTLRIVMDNDKYVLLDSGTVLELSAAGNSSDSRTKIDLKEGTILNEITKPLSANSSYEVTTPKATMAVRGTSFMVSVEKQQDGSYIIHMNTFDGKVEVVLLDENGDPTDKTALVEAGSGITVCTEPNTSSGRPAEIDGISRFVFEDENGVLSELNEGDDPIHDIRYALVSRLIKESALRSNDEQLMVLSADIVRHLRGETEEEAESSAAETAPEEEPIVTSAPIAEDIPEVTTVPETSETEEISTQTAAPAVEQTPEEVQPAAVVYDEEVTSAENVGQEQTTAKKTTDTSAPKADKTDETSRTTVTTVTSAPAEPDNEETAGSHGSDVTEPETEPPVTVTEASKTSASRYTYTNYTYNTNNTNHTTYTTPETDEAVYAVVSFYCDGELVDRITVRRGGTVANMPEIPEKTGKVGVWKTGSAEFTSVTVINSDMTVNAEYSTKLLTVTFIADGDIVKTVELEYNSPIKEYIPEVPEKSGYTGVWFLGDSELDPTVNVTEDITVTANYQELIENYTVTFMASFSRVLYTQAVSYGERPSYTPPTVYDSDGDGNYDYYLWGWDSVSGRYSAVTGDTSITVPYVPYNDIFEVRLIDASGTVVDKLFRSGESFTFPNAAVTESNGKKFKGWGVVSSGGGTYNTGLKEESGSVFDNSHGYIEGESYPYKPGVTISITRGANGNGNMEYRAVYVNEITVTVINGDSTRTIKAFEGDTLNSMGITSSPTKGETVGKWVMDNGNAIDIWTAVTEDTTITAVYPDDSTSDTT